MAKIRASSGETPRLSSRTCVHSGRAKTPPIIRTASPAVAQRSKNQPMLTITNVRSTRNAWKPREAVSRAQRSFIRLYRGSSSAVTAKITPLYKPQRM